MPKKSARQSVQRQSQSSAVDSLLKKAATLNERDLLALKEGIEVLLQTPPLAEDRDEHGKPRNQKGFIEEKMINGCGPYQYLRYWNGKKHCSVYLGKVDSEKKSK